MDIVEADIEVINTDIDTLATSVTTLNSEVATLQTQIRGALLFTAEIVWTNAELKAGTTKNLVAAQGAGVPIIPMMLYMRFNYGGTNAFTNNPTITLCYNATSAQGEAITGFNFLAVNSNILQKNGWDAPLWKQLTNVANQTLDLTLSAALTGNAANNNEVRIQLFYLLGDNLT